jgi:hypothetical protein
MNNYVSYITQIYFRTKTFTLDLMTPWIYSLPVIKGGRPVNANNFTAICDPICYKMYPASTSHNTMGLHGLLRV